ncbi:RND transporter [Rhizocola hellebori]|uniref:RND transporter n=1 Tax=Rhizocola hellebori TaxID=1392758 RepID=A0A8J3VKX1_9ACTN|nr:efflux RND transporter periplasmic adaptor subunit [Rhizocola hellebori]GIH09508.1 RND transporter [Rhizocola hellebori]
MRPLVLLSAVLLTLSLTAASCEDAPDVTVAQVGLGTVSEVVEAPASVTARAATALTAPANGTLASLSVKPGSTVAKGQTVAVVDSPEAQARLTQATEALAAAKSSGSGGGKVNLGGAQTKLDQAAAKAFAEARAAAQTIADPAHRDTALAEIAQAEAHYATVSQGTWQTIKAVEKGIASLTSGLKALGAAQVMQAQQAYDLAKSTVDALTLTAPIAGVVQLGGTSGGSATPTDLTSLLGGLSGGLPAAPAAGPMPGVASTVAVGAPVSAGTAILTIVDVSELGLVAEVDETDVLLVSPGLAADAELDAAPGTTLTASVTAIDVLPTSNSRGAVAYKVHLILTPGAVTPRPGMSALVRLKVREASNTISVPAAAVFNVDGQDTVWVRSEANKAQKRRVKVGVSGRDVLQIADGLRQGEWIVVRGADRVSEGSDLP